MERWLLGGASGDAAKQGLRLRRRCARRSREATPLVMAGLVPAIYVGMHANVSNKRRNAMKHNAL